MADKRSGLLWFALKSNTTLKMDSLRFFREIKLELSKESFLYIIIQAFSDESYVLKLVNLSLAKIRFHQTYFASEVV